MALSADMRLFARKGEAAPAGVALDEAATDAPMAGFEPTSVGSGSRYDDGGSNDGAGLSFLIQRRTPSTATEPARKRAIAPANGAKRAKAADAAAVSSSPPAKPATARPSPRPTKRAQPAGRDDAPEEWRKLSFRVRLDQYRKLKALSGLWGASYQGILERAVAAFVDSAIGAEEADWDA